MGWLTDLAQNEIINFDCVKQRSDEQSCTPLYQFLQSFRINVNSSNALICLSILRSRYNLMEKMLKYGVQIWQRKLCSAKRGLIKQNECHNYNKVM